LASCGSILAIVPPLGINPRTSIQLVGPEHLWFYVYRDATPRRDYRWRLIAGNSKRIANSGEGYRNLIDCEAAINLVASSDGKPIRYAPGIRR
jgi:uncharacterized protein YegP (UPF0339 family)